MVHSLSLVQARAEMPTYLFLDFEPESLWTRGPLPSDERRIISSQGLAEIVRVDEKDSTQVLQLSPSKPFSAVLVDASPLAKSPEVYCEVLARPFAVDETTDEEFFDFGGAILGFFRQGDRGEIWALFSQTDESSVWISTGIQFVLDEDGSAAEWIQLRVRLDRTTDRWALAVNGQLALDGLTLVEMKSDLGLTLFLYGHETHGNQFDDVLLSDIAPDELESTLNRLTRGRLAGKQAAQIRPKVVMQQKQRLDLRRTQSLLQVPDPTSTQVLRGWHLSLDTGQRTYESKPRSDATGDQPSIVAYAPGYDDDGNPLPATLTITADAALRPGVDLSRLRWRVMEVIGWPDKFGKLVGEGDFRSGLVQQFVLPPEWTRKATSVVVFMEAGKTP